MPRPTPDDSHEGAATSAAEAVSHTVEYKFDETNFHIDEDYYECSCGRQWIASDAIRALDHEERANEGRLLAHEPFALPTDTRGKRRRVVSRLRAKVEKGN